MALEENMMADLRHVVLSILVSRNDDRTTRRKATKYRSNTTERQERQRERAKTIKRSTTVNVVLARSHCRLFALFCRLGLFRLAILSS